MTHGPRQRKLNPYRVLCVILFADTDFITWTSPEVATVKLGPLSRSLGLPNYRVREYLLWLEHNQYIANLDLSYGQADFSVLMPQRKAG